jgi:hypothetical protein
MTDQQPTSTEHEHAVLNRSRRIAAAAAALFVAERGYLPSAVRLSEPAPVCLYAVA